MEGMKMAVVKVINGAFSIDSEWSDLDKAKVQFHNVCMNLWNAKDVISATVMLVYENLVTVESYVEYISHPEEAPEAEEPTNE